MRTFRRIDVKCFNRLKFLAEISTKLEKSTFLENLGAITHGGNMETSQMTPSTFSALTVCNIHFCI